MHMYLYIHEHNYMHSFLNLLLFMPSLLVKISFICTDGGKKIKTKELLIGLFIQDLKPSVWSIPLALTAA